MLCGHWSNADPVLKQQNKKRMKAVIKMFFVMGVTWILELVGWIVDYKYGTARVHKYVLPLDLINSLQVKLQNVNKI